MNQIFMTGMCMGWAGRRGRDFVSYGCSTRDYWLVQVDFKPNRHVHCTEGLLTLATNCAQRCLVARCEAGIPRNVPRAGCDQPSACRQPHDGEGLISQLIGDFADIELKGRLHLRSCSDSHTSVRTKIIDPIQINRGEEIRRQTGELKRRRTRIENEMKRSCRIVSD